ncbi:DUF4296 domain-containing protein [Aquimarina aggregata]|uniref:DUF4296 domain-containing protein n=1 Tax=Aquimarina aggregata TaxID=1642818 RepID=UPI00248F61C2|nr:DUF4296 domain-containing protein [Aquimarina aggregata]
MIKKRHICFVMILVALACQSIDKIEQPKILLGEDQMVEVLTDIAFVKAAKGSYKRFLEENKMNPETYILQKHNIDSIVFEENNIWYSGQLDTYEKIFTRVKANLEESKNKYEKIRKEEDSIKKIQDSINKVKDTLTDKKELLKDDESMHQELMQLDH